MIPFFVYLLPTLISAFLLWLLLVTTEEQKNVYHTLLFITVFFVNLAYYCVSVSSSTNEALLATKFTYFSGTFLTLFTFKCILQICNIKTKHIWFVPLILLDTEVMVSVFITETTHWHYRWVKLIHEEGYSYLLKGYGPHHMVYYVVLAINMLLPLITIIWAFHHKKQVSWLYVLWLGTAEILTVMIYFAERAFSAKIELLPYTYDAVLVVIYMILRRSSIYDVNVNARLSFDNTKDVGFVMLDSSLRYVGSDDVAKKYFPELLDLEIDKPISNPKLRHEFGDWVLESLEHTVEPIVVERFGAMVKVTVSPFYSASGKRLVGYAIRISDDTATQTYISKLKESKALAEEMAEKADAANRSKSEFLANISHEIRTPINAVLGFNEMVIRESSEDKIRNYAVDIKNSGNTMLGLINDLLDLSKIESGKMELVPVTFDLINMLKDIINMTGVRAADKGLSFDVDIDKEIPRKVVGDEIRIKQILMNVLTNAVKYTEKGSVNFTMSHKKCGDGRIDLSVKVKDTGIGMKPETIEHLFIPYERLDQQRNRYIEGTGLGMSIAHTLLELMDSKLEVESEYGKGSTFSFTINLPVSGTATVGNIRDNIEKMRENIKEYKVSFTAPDAHVLVVDDTAVNISIFKGLLKRTLVQIDSATSGEYALELTSKRKYDAIFIDHMMPDMDGIETFKAIKASEDNPNHDTPMVMMTANVNANSRELYLSIGFDDYIGKPVDPLLLESMLRRIL
ncbi:MAG: response regulator [Lachnospiraceae bacterium]|nr:response regulator [Lachnospiraceae bacterium]